LIHSHAGAPRSPLMALADRRRLTSPLGGALSIGAQILHAETHQFRALTNTEAFEQSRRERKKIEMCFAHMKRTFRPDRLRLRGLSGARDEVLLTATAQNLRRLVKFVCRSPPIAATACPA
jgi:hypothetical protein